MKERRYPLMKPLSRLLIFFIVIYMTIFLVSCVERYAQPTARVDTGVAQQLPPYSGPKARLAVARFEWKVGTGGATTTITGVGRRDIKITHEQSGIMTGLRDMLTTALVQTGRYRVLERQEISAIKEEIALGEEGYVEEESAIKKGRIKGADLLVVAAITGWEPGTSGTKGGVGVFGGGVLGGILGGYEKSSLAMDIRLIDTSTSEILAATRIEGEARDVNLGALAGGILGDVGLGGFLSTYANTPMEKAIRIAINEAVKYIVSATPPEYFRH
jgi:curli biogenesis system outer membrane secretion channel CsgG